MRWLRLFVSTLLQLLFGCFAAAGAGGLVAVVGRWSTMDEGGRGPLACVGLLCAAAVFVGIRGVVVAGMRGRGEAIPGRPWYEYAHRSAVGNILAGSLLVAVGVGWCILSLRIAQEVGGRMYIWYGPIAVGLLQLAGGIRQYRSRPTGAGSAVEQGVDR